MDERTDRQLPFHNRFGSSASAFNTIASVPGPQSDENKATAAMHLVSLGIRSNWHSARAVERLTRRRGLRLELLRECEISFSAAARHRLFEELLAAIAAERNERRRQRTLIPARQQRMISGRQLTRHRRRRQWPA